LAAVKDKTAHQVTSAFLFNASELLLSHYLFCLQWQRCAWHSQQ